MEILAAFQISASAMEAQRIRLGVLSSNLANAQTTRTPEGGAYRRRDVVFAQAPEGFGGILQTALGKGGVTVAGLIEDPRPLRVVYDPGHPDATPEGYVTLPNVNLLEEMVNLIAATRSYEANVTAFNLTKTMALKALEMGRV